MAGFILGEKSDTTQLFNDEGERVPATFIKTAPCFLIDVMLPGKRQYFAVKLGFGKARNIKKPAKEELAKAGIKTPLRFFREFRLEKYGTDVGTVDENNKRGLTLGEIKILQGEEVKPSSVFKVGEMVTIAGKSKGKGFQGGVKRHGFSGGPKTHGQSDRLRAPGSIGQTTTPGRVLKGKRMAGRMGGERITVKNLKVIEVRDDGIYLKGLVPGARGGLIEISSSV